jgi:hypothetical protein
MEFLIVPLNLSIPGTGGTSVATARLKVSAKAKLSHFQPLPGFAMANGYRPAYKPWEQVDPQGKLKAVVTSRL